jgi:hypothetical protein
VRPIVAVLPGEVEAFAELASKMRRRGLELAVWPMLEDAQGRWLHGDNAAAFREHVQRVLQSTAARGSLPSELVLDLEPDIKQVRRWVHGSLPPLHRGGRRFERTTEAVGAIAAVARGRGVGVSAAVIPAVLWDSATGWPRSAGWQRWLGTPVEGVSFDRVFVMLYSSLLEGYVPGFGRRDARRLLYMGCRAARRRFGARAYACLGLTGSGALGDERAYRGPAELAEDVAIARTAGVAGVAVHGLAGIRDRPSVERWLAALRSRQVLPSPPAPTWKASCFETAGRMAAPVLARLTR